MAREFQTPSLRTANLTVLAESFSLSSAASRGPTAPQQALTYLIEEVSLRAYLFIFAVVVIGCGWLYSHLTAHGHGVNASPLGFMDGVFVPEIAGHFGGGVILVRDVDERLGLETIIADHLCDSRYRRNELFRFPDLLRQSIYSRLAGYAGLNDAVCLSAAPTLGHRPVRLTLPVWFW